MKNQLIAEITRQMLPHLDNAQIEQLQNVLRHCLWNVEVTESPEAAQETNQETNGELLDMFLSAKRVQREDFAVLRGLHSPAVCVCGLPCNPHANRCAAKLPLRLSAEQPVQQREY